MEHLKVKLKEALDSNSSKIKQAKEVLEFPTYLLGVQEGLEGALRLAKQIEKEDWSGK